MNNDIIKKYIENNIDLIEHDEWEEFFKHAPYGVGGILYEADISFMEELGYIPADAFFCCYNLTSMTIPNQVTSIGDGAFLSCGALKNIQFKGTLKEWNSIDMGDNVFYNCPADYVQCLDGKALI